MSDQVFGAHDAHHRIRTAISAESVATTGAPAGVPLSSGGVTSSHCDASLANLLALCIPILKEQGCDYNQDRVCHVEDSKGHQ